MKARYAVLVALIVVLVGVAGLGETSTVIIGDAQSVVVSGSLDFTAATVIDPSHEGVVVCDGVLVIDVYFNNNVTLTLNATSFVCGVAGKTLLTEYALVAVGAGPSWFCYDSLDLNVGATVGTEFTNWTNSSLVWVDPTNPPAGLTFPHDWPLLRSAYPSGRKYINAKVRVTRDGYADPAGTYTATVTVTIK